MMVIELATHALFFHLEKNPLDYGFFNPYRQIPEYRVSTPPTHYTTEGGGHYSARPDLTRPGGPAVYVAGTGAALVVGSLYGAAVITSAYNEIIEDEDPNVQQSLWLAFTQALTGGPGIGTGLSL